MINGFRIVIDVPDASQEEFDATEHNVFISVQKDIPFVSLMMATEYLMFVLAQQSEAGFERALELLVTGAMTYENKNGPINLSEIDLQIDGLAPTGDSPYLNFVQETDFQDHPSTDLEPNIDLGDSDDFDDYEEWEPDGENDE